FLAAALVFNARLGGPERALRGLLASGSGLEGLGFLLGLGTCVRCGALLGELRGLALGIGARALGSGRGGLCLGLRADLFLHALLGLEAGAHRFLGAALLAFALPGGECGGFRGFLLGE